MKNKPQNGAQELRAFSMPDLQANETGNTVEGHAAVFGNTYDMYWYTETVARGAFDKTDLTDVLFSVNHDLKSIPLAHSRNNNAKSTLQLQVDDVGLATRSVLDIENNSNAKALYGSIQRGDINAMSFIFTVRNDEWTGLDTDKPNRTITDIAKVYEVSAVSMPANPDTDINARSQSELDSSKGVLDSARAKVGELAEQREIEILKLKTEILMKG
ncbi:MAG: HK97 family phage prohead protease [Herbinix sp.]|nr:HK97 family phage prohead protease [Herbinix sp.]